jgi:hypothetical protein
VQSGRILLTFFRAEETQNIEKCGMATGERMARAGTNKIILPNRLHNTGHIPKVSIFIITV